MNVVRVDVLPYVREANRVLVVERVGGCYGQAALGRYWLPCAELGDGEQPQACAERALREATGLSLEGSVVVGTRQHQVESAWHLALVLAGTCSGTPDVRPPVSGFSVRPVDSLPDQVGFYHRDEVALLLGRYRILANL